ncbi:MAG: endonuclease/exonuclease/phosphatase family metal-dependent hydrolase [Planctomycetota bacterium]|jgi:endonuclease/exonuclease/phosphatase family metal-dependent hydrolase
MRFNVGTLNARALPEPWSKSVRARMYAIGRRLPALGLDVMAFQEVYSPDAKEILTRAASDAGFSYQWDAGQQMSLGGGLLIVSRLPIEQRYFEAFTVSGHAERALANGEFLSGKGFAVVRVRTDAGPVQILTTHLHARYSRYASHRHVAYRAAQIIQIAASIEQTNVPLVLLGDFNFLEGEDDYHVMTGLTSARDVAAELSLRRPTATATAANPYRASTRNWRKDFVFARDCRERGLSALKIERVFDEPIQIVGGLAAYSDHYGLAAELALVEQSERVPVAVPAPRQLAERLLREGGKLSEARLHDHLSMAVVGVGTAIACSAGARQISGRSTRRMLLRGLLATGAVGALTPSLLSEILIPQEVRAFENAQATLARLSPQATGGELRQLLSAVDAQDAVGRQ